MLALESHFATRYRNAAALTAVYGLFMTPLGTYEADMGTGKANTVLESHTRCDALTGGREQVDDLQCKRGGGLTRHSVGAQPRRR